MPLPYAASIRPQGGRFLLVCKDINRDAPGPDMNASIISSKGGDAGTAAPPAATAAPVASRLPAAGGALPNGNPGSSIRWLRLLLAASVVVPVFLFCGAAWENRRQVI